MELQIGSIIAQVRRSKGMTQEALAGAVGVSSAAVSKWETAASYPDITLLPPLARALGVTVDALFDFRAEPTDDEIRALSARLRKTFDEHSFEAGRREAEALLCEYPSSGALKLVVGGQYYRFIASALNSAADTGQTMQELNERCLALFEQGERQTDNVNEAIVAKVLRINALILLGRYEEAESLIGSLPPKNLADTAVLSLSLYLAQDKLDEAEQIARRELLTHVTEVSTALMSLLTIARRKRDFAAAHRFADAYDAVNELFCLDCSNSLLLRIQLAQDEGDTGHALDLFVQYIDTRLAYTLDYRGNPFFAGVQTSVPSKNELAAHMMLYK